MQRHEQLIYYVKTNFKSNDDSDRELNNRVDVCCSVECQSSSKHDKILKLFNAQIDQQLFDCLKIFNNDFRDFESMCKHAIVRSNSENVCLTC